MIRTTIVIVAAFAFAATLPAISAHAAARDRVFVASYGSDSNPCTFGSPCKTFQQAINTVAPGGEVTAIDSAGFGPFTVSHAITITSPNGVEAGIATPSGGTAITINAESSTDIIQLNGLTLDGVGGATTGIQFNSGGRLNVRDSVIRNFGANGINFVPNSSSQISVSNTLVADNGNHGIAILPTGMGTTNSVLNHVDIENNSGFGLNVTSVGQTINVTFNDSVCASNLGTGIIASGTSPVNLMVRNSTIANNGVNGLGADLSGATVRVTRSTITGNFNGWIATRSGIVSSYADNNIDGNGGANTEPTPALIHQ